MTGVKITIEKALAGQVSYAEFHNIWGEQISARASAGIPLKPGVLALLGALQAQGLPCAVATSTRTEAAVQHLETAGLGGYFQAIIGGEQVLNGKPAPDIYVKAAKELGADPAKCAAFEDSDPGALAAIASGAVVVQVPDMKQPGQNLRDNGHVIAKSLIWGARKVGLII